MTEWMISANAKVYDHNSSFEQYNYIDWKQGRTKYAINDIVYIYATKPTSLVRYKCIVEKVNLASSEIRDDKEFWVSPEAYENSLAGKFIRLKLLNQFSNSSLNLKNLKLNGLSAAPQGPIKITSELSNYLKKHCTDDLQSEYFPDVIDDDEINFEGIKKKITVNMYERSSVAREKCIKYHGLTCCVCEMNFLDRYGEIGKFFIHIHHLKPISEIGKEYKVDYKKDLVPVCPNCHAMLHRKLNGKELSIEELKQILQERHSQI